MLKKEEKEESRKKKPGIVVHAVGAGESGVQGQHPLNSEFKASLDMIPWLPSNKTGKKEQKYMP